MKMRIFGPFLVLCTRFVIKTAICTIGMQFAYGFKNFFGEVDGKPENER